MIKLSILWDEKELNDTNSEKVLEELVALYSEYKKEVAASVSGCAFIGVATERDRELIKTFFDLPLEVREKLLTYIKSTFIDKSETLNINLKELLLSSPHKDVEIHITRSPESGRDIIL